MTDTINIRLARDNDFEVILRIWLDRIGNSFDTATMDTDLAKTKFLRNFKSRNGSFNFWVAVDNNDNVVGWQSLIKCFDHPFKDDIYAESSTYIAKENRLKGLGELLLNHAISEAKNGDIEYLVGFVATNNEAAKKITKSTGWIEVGIMPTSSNSNLTKHFLIRPIRQKNQQYKLLEC